jgi:uncharacterized protein YndB with AHSA1/START domain
MTYELRIERLFDAPPELVFDTMVDPDAQEAIFAGQVEGWSLSSFDIDLRVGGRWTILYGPSGGQGESDRLESVFTEIDRPRRLAYDSSMFVAEWGRTVDFTETITLGVKDGETLLTNRAERLRERSGPGCVQERDAGVPRCAAARRRIEDRRVRRRTCCSRTGTCMTDDRRGDAR